MKKYKLLRFGRYYVNREGDFVICLLKGSKKKGYTFVGSHANPPVILGKFGLLSRIVPNDGHWIEIDSVMFDVVSAMHTNGYVVEFPTKENGRKLPLISKKY